MKQMQSWILAVPGCVRAIEGQKADRFKLYRCLGVLSRSTVQDQPAV